MCLGNILFIVFPVGYVGFTQSSYSAKEGDGVVSICIELLGDQESYVLGKLLSLRLSTEGETAQG